MNKGNTEFGIRYNPGKDVIYKYVITNKRNISHTINGIDGLTLHTEEKMHFKYRIGMDNEKPCAIVLFDSLHVINWGNYLESETEGPLEKALNSIKSFELKIFFDDHWKILEIKGLTAFQERIDSLYNSFQDYSAKPVSISIYNEKYFREIFENKLNILPDTIVHINSTWVGSDIVELKNEKLNLKVKYTVTDLIDGIASISSYAEIDKEIMLNVTTPIRVLGMQKGEIKMEQKTGMLISSIKSIDLHGSVKKDHLSVALHVENKNETNLCP